LAGIGIVLACRAVAVRRRMALAAVLLGTGVAVILPWEAWLAARTGTVAVLSTGGPASVRDGLTFGVDPREEQGAIPLPGDLRRLMGDAQHQQHRLASLSGTAGFLGDEAHDRPPAVPELVAYKAA